MKKVLIIFFSVILILVVGYFALGYVSSFVGWYGYKKWQFRVATSNMEESKKRGVFIKELQFQVDSFSGKILDFKPYIEKGFKYGLHSSEETVPLFNSNYPYQLSINFHPSERIGILIKEGELKKFDSSSSTRGYLKYPDLKDTIIMEIIGKNIHSGIIKIWQ